MSFARKFLLALLAVLLIATSAVTAREQVRVPDSLAQVKLSFAPVVKKARPAVVNVYARQVVRARRRLPMLFDDPFFREFFDDHFGFGMPEERVRNSLGSGVIVSGKGLIITNNHVIENATDIRIVLADRREFSARVLARDEGLDLALLKIRPAGPLPVLKLGDSDALEVGDVVLAIGNPFGVGQTVTMGIVSALGRNNLGRSRYQHFIQTDAAINPGNSGGALVNLRGELVGINTMIVSRSGGNVGIGFAVPVNLVRSFMENARRGITARPWGGVKLRGIDTDMAEALGLGRPMGALVEELHPQSPLKKAGIRVGDVILAIDGKPLRKASEFGYRLASRPLGSDAVIDVLRDGRRKSFKVKRVPKPSGLRKARTLRGRHMLSGLRVVEFDGKLARRLGVPVQRGVMVVDALRGSARGLRLQRRDVIMELNGRRINSIAMLEQALKSAKGRVLSITVWRRGAVIRMRFG